MIVTLFTRRINYTIEFVSGTLKGNQYPMTYDVPASEYAKHIANLKVMRDTNKVVRKASSFIVVSVEE